MRYIYSERGGGKSTFLVTYLKNNPHAIAIFANRQRLASVLSQHRQHIPNIDQRLFTIAEMLIGTVVGTSVNTTAVIDDVEDVLQQLLAAIPIEFATTSAPTTQLNPQVIDHLKINEAGQKYSFAPGPAPEESGRR
jgi:hypothetical protein